MILVKLSNFYDDSKWNPNATTLVGGNKKVQQQIVFNASPWGVNIDETNETIIIADSGNKRVVRCAKTKKAKK